jgi:hypothetical protein
MAAWPNKSGASGRLRDLAGLASRVSGDWPACPDFGRLAGVLDRQQQTRSGVLVDSQQCRSDPFAIHFVKPYKKDPLVALLSIS